VHKTEEELPFHRNGRMYSSSTEYLDGFHYASSVGDKELWQMFQDAGGNAYEMEAFIAFTTETNFADVLKFFPTAEGFYDFENSEYIYQYKDQVGNIRLSYKADANNNAEVVKESNYYPFGLEHKGDNQTNTAQPAYKYGFQEQEKQEETGWSSFKWRNYDPSMGRFFNIDPLSEKYAYQSHYNFSENAVVAHRELEGLEKISIHTASFAPFDSFGGPLPTPYYNGHNWSVRIQGPFHGDGANRQYGTDPKASSRIYGRVDLDLGASSAKEALVDTYARGSESIDIVTGETTWSEAAMNTSLLKTDNQFKLDMHLFGNNDLVPVSPDIDTKPSMTLTTTALSNGNKMVHIRGGVTGDGFPSNETYITGQNGVGVTLGNSNANAGSIKGPTTSLPGNNNRPMSQFNQIIYFDKDDNIIPPPKN